MAKKQYTKGMTPREARPRSERLRALGVHGSTVSGTASSDYLALKAAFSSHAADSDIHVTAEEKAAWDLVASLFGVDDNGDIYPKDNRGFWTNSFLSARGADAEAGGGGGLDVTAMWAALAAGTSEQINASHIPELSISKITGLQDALDSKLSAITRDMVESVLTGTVTSHNHDGIYAPLSGGVIPSQYLPSYVDDVLEYASKSSFPASGEAGKIYVALDTNLTYRWGGSSYVEISPSLALGYTSSTAYPGNEGAANASAIATLQGYFTGGAANKVAHALTISYDGGTAVKFDGSSALSVTIPSDEQRALWDKICALFDIDEDGNVYVTGNRGFWTSAFLSARGADPEAGGGGGVDMEAVWAALAAGTSEQINASHIPALGLLSGTVSNAQLANSSITVAGYEAPLGGGVTVAQIATALTGAGYKLTDTTYGLATDTTAGLVKTGYLTQVGTKNYGVKLNSLGQMYVSVPWTDTVTTLASLGITATAAELNKLDGLATTATELGYVHGVTSNIQTQLDAKANASSMNNYALKDGSNATGIWQNYSKGIYATETFPGYILYNAVNNDKTTIGSTDTNFAWGTPKESQESSFGNGQILRLVWAGSEYYTDIFSAPNAAGTQYGLQWRQIVNGAISGGRQGGWRELLDDYNYKTYTVTKTGDGASGTWAISISGNAATATRLATPISIWGQSTDDRTSITGDMIGVGSITMSGNLICGTTISSDIRNSFRSSIFKNSTRGFRIKEVRTDVSVGNFCSIYGSALAWAGEDTHGWLAVGYEANTKLAYIGSGNVDKINWSEQLWHSGNSNLLTVNWAVNNLMAAGQVSANNGFASSKNNTYALTDANILSNGILAVSTKIVGHDTVQPMITWSNNVSSYGFITRYSISSVRPFGDQWGRMRLAVGANDAGTLIGCYLDIDGDGFVSISKALQVGTDATISGNLTTSGTIYSATGIWSDGYVSAHGVDTTSDRKFKDGIAPLGGKVALAVIHALKPSTWTWNALAKARGRSAGFIAQDVAGILPDAIREIGEDKHLTLNYQMLHAYEVAALQEHDDEIQRLRRKVTEMENKIKDIWHTGQTS